MCAPKTAKIKGNPGGAHNLGDFLRGSRGDSNGQYSRGFLKKYLKFYENFK